MKKKQKHHKKEIKEVTISKRHKLILGLIIAIVGFLIYSNTLGHDYALDDYSVIKENWVTKKGTDGIATHLKNSYRYGYWSKQGTLYRPLSLVMFAIEWQIANENKDDSEILLQDDFPALSHFLNVLFYALTGLLLFLTLSKVMIKYNIIIPFVISLLYISHPIHTEVVANIKSRDEIMSLFFVLIAINLLWTHLKNNKIVPLFLALISFFLAMISKEGVITIIGIIPLTIYFFTDIKIGKNLLKSALFIIPALLYLYLRKKVIGHVGGLEVSVVDNLLVAANGFQEKAGTAIMIMGKYLGLLIYPNPLVSDYSYNQIPIVNFGNYKVIISIIIHLGIFVYAIMQIKKKSIISYGILFYLITVSIYSNIIIMIGSSFGERFLYIASLGFIMVFSFIIVRIFKKDTKYKGFTKLSEFFTSNLAIIGIAFLVLIIYSFKTIDRNADWKNNNTLYTADIKNSPNSAHMCYYYGLTLMKDEALNENKEIIHPEYLDSAIFQFARAAEIHPSYADAYDQLGLAYFRKGENENALKYYKKAIELNPYRSIVYNNMGIIYFQKGEYENALDVYKKAVEFDPHFADAYMNLGSVYGTLSQFDKAIENFLKAIEYNPYNPKTYYFLGLSYQSAGDNANAQKYFNKAYQMDPSLKSN